ncbi:hypothetical protein [Kitasatospora cineracea]|uniref:hypothetical protein n=1 Tax=Kitasatospora cineracea TaxID=88074 RepID=UPI0036A2473C
MNVSSLTSRTIIKLLFDADFVYREDTGTWSHDDGRPFSRTEQMIAEAAGEEELAALVQVYGLLSKRDLVSPVDAIRVLCYRYWAMLPEGADTYTNVLAVMTDWDRAECERLYDQLTPPSAAP